MLFLNFHPVHGIKALQLLIAVKWVNKQEILENVKQFQCIVYL